MNMWFEMADQTSFCISTSHKYNPSPGKWPCRVEPGDSIWFEYSVPELLKHTEGKKMVAVLAIDKIHRQFRSPPGELESAINSARGGCAPD
jgi:hypothetical protein